MKEFTKRGEIKMNGKIEQLIMNGKYQEAWIAIAEYEKNIRLMRIWIRIEFYV